MPRPARLALLLLSGCVAGLACLAWVASLFTSARVSYGVVDCSREPLERATERSVALLPHRLVFRSIVTRYDHTRGLLTLAGYLPTGINWGEVPASAAADGRSLLPAVFQPPPVDTGFGRRVRTDVALPLWIAVLAGVAPPAVAAGRWRRRRSRPAVCRRCGYDVRASPSRCPECGTPAVTPPPPPASAGPPPRSA